MGMEVTPILKLTKDLKDAATVLSDKEARFLVDMYYQMQDNRIRAEGQVRSMSGDNEEPHEVISWLAKNTRGLENQVKRALDAYSLASPLGRWARSHKGVGPVIAAGLLAHIAFEVNGERVNTASRIWSFAGLANKEWDKGQKRPWNARLKTLCWKLGESFVKVSGYDDAAFGKLYVERKNQEVERNERGEFADQAARKLEKFKIGKTTDAYKAYSTGKLPPAHLHARAKRWAVKLFLACYHRQGYRILFGEEPPAPYPIAHLGHADLIDL
jgi:hypothetical protein